MRTKIFLATFTVVLMLGCSTNPVTGDREFSLVSRSQEKAIGAQAHQQTLQQFGVYGEKPEVNRMVNRVGQRIAAISDMPELKWTFTVLDSPMLNAMALPGGYVYITRGMLERMNSEDELAGVLAHEIAHVTARHAAQRISQAQLAQLGMIAGAIAAPEVMQQYGDLVQLGASLLFQRYSRAQESQSDLVGTAYMAEAGYNPAGAREMLRTLDRLRDQEQSAIDQYFQSHPDPAKRIDDVQQKLVELEQANPAFLNRSMERAPFLTTLEGMITGRSTERVTIKNNTIHEKKHGIVLRYPSSYEAQSGFGGLFQLIPKEGGGIIQVDQLPLGNTPPRQVQNALRQRYQQMGLEYQNTYKGRLSSGQGLPVDLWAGRTQRGVVAVETSYFVDQGDVVVFMEVSPQFRRGQSPLAATLREMRIDKRAARSARPPRLEVDRAASRDSWTDLARRATGDPNDARELAAINGYDPDTRVPNGLVVKLPEQIIGRN